MGSAKLETPLSLKDFAPAYPVESQCVTCPYRTVRSQVVRSNHHQLQYSRLSHQALQTRIYQNMFGVRCTSTSQYSSHHANLCIRFVRLYSLGDNQSLSTPCRSLKHPILFTFARSEEYPREALPRGAGGCLSEVLL